MVTVKKYGLLTNNASNNRGELTAIKEALDYIENNKIDGPIKIISDSEYSIKCITKWGPSWINKNKQDEMKNTDLIIPLVERIKNLEIEFIHINSHQNEPSHTNVREFIPWYMNSEADRLCQLAFADNDKQ